MLSQLAVGWIQVVIADQWLRPWQPYCICSYPLKECPIVPLKNCNSPVQFSSTGSVDTDYCPLLWILTGMALIGYCNPGCHIISESSGTNTTTVEDLLVVLAAGVLCHFSDHFLDWFLSELCLIW